MVSVALCCACSDVVWAILCCAGVVWCCVVLRCVVCKAKSKDKGYGKGKGKVLHIGDYKNPVFLGLG